VLRIRHRSKKHPAFAGRHCQLSFGDRQTRAPEGFMNAASPGVIALFLPNKHYKTQDEYLEALAEAMQPEYEAIVAAGFILQLDCPDVGLGRHMLFKNEPEESYIRLATRHIEVLNHALRNVPSDRVRMHVCWGNYEGPHHHDAPMQVVLPYCTESKTTGPAV
jgi:5-methyltetrahydropteroyltriglutamate--homocysteine methyltransferase